tara:strand:- start:159 stop:278 length:120 start_codon:yes stop_codon:yes gene_type:complete
MRRRGGFGPRPVTITAAEIRVMFAEILMLALGLCAELSS